MINVAPLRHFVETTTEPVVAVPKDTLLQMLNELAIGQAAQRTLISIESMARVAPRVA